MKKLSLLLFLFSILISCNKKSVAQTSTVQATITDGAAQPFSYGNYKIEYDRPASGVGATQAPVRSDTGVALTPAQLTFSGNLDASGAFSGVIVTRNDFIFPTGSRWKFTICSKANSACFSHTTAITTPTANLSTELSTAAGFISVITGNDLFKVSPRAYVDAEVSGHDWGSLYWNITTRRLRAFDGTSWIDVGSNILGCSGTGQILYNGAGPAFDCESDLQYDETNNYIKMGPTPPALPITGNDGGLALTNNYVIASRTTGGTIVNLLKMSSTNEVILGDVANTTELTRINGGPQIWIEAKGASTHKPYLLIDRDTDSFTFAQAGSSTIHVDILDAGTTLPTVGILRIPNNKFISSRNSAAGSIALIGLDSSDGIQIGTSFGSFVQANTVNLGAEVFNCCDYNQRGATVIKFWNSANTQSFSLSALGTLASSYSATWNITGNCNSLTNGGALTINASNQIVCSDDDGGAGGGGTTITVNGVALTSPTQGDLDDATPAAPTNGFNVIWQKDTSTPTNISAYLLTTTINSTTFGNNTGNITWTFDPTGATNPQLNFQNNFVSITNSATFNLSAFNFNIGDGSSTVTLAFDPTGTTQPYMNVGTSSFDFFDNGTPGVMDVRIETSDGVLTSLKDTGHILSGTFAKARQHATTVYNDQGNTYTTGAQDFGSATSLKIPTSAGAAPTASGLLAYDSTSNTLEAGVNGVNKTVFFTDTVATLAQLPVGASNQLYKVNAGGTAVENATLSGVASEIDVTFGVGTISIGIVDPLGIAKGGTSAATSQGAINALSQLTTNGDLLYYNGTNSTRLPRGTDTQCLVSNTTTILWSSSCGGGGGTTITVNGSALTASTGDFDDTTPAAPSNGFNAHWQKDALTPTNISAHILTTDIGTTTFGNGTADFTWSFNDTGASSATFAWAAGKITLTAAGTNQDIALIPSGTGNVTISTGLVIAGGSALTTSNQSGTGNIVMTTSPTMTNITVNQAANGNTVITSTRATDTAPTGNFELYRNAAAGTVWQVDITGSLAAGTIPVARVTGLATVATSGSYADLSSRTHVLTGADHSESGLTTGTVLRATGATTFAWGAVDLANASAVTGVLPVGNWSPLTTNGDLIYHNGTTTTRLARGTNGQCLTSDATTILWGSCGAGGGDAITVNTTAATDANFNDTSPSAPANGFNVKWQIGTVANPDDISAYLDTTTVGTTTWGSGSTFTWTFNSSATGDTTLRFGTNEIDLVRGTVAQTFRVYNTESGADSEYVELTWVTNRAILRTDTSGIGVARDLSIRSDIDLFLGAGAADIWFIDDAAGNGFKAVTDNASDIGASGANRPRTGYFGTSVISPIFDASTGYRIAGGATIGNVLRGNGTNFVSAQLAVADLSGLPVTIAQGGTGATTSQDAINAISQLTTNGDLLYHNGTNSTRLARGTNGQCLTSNTTTIIWGSCGGAGGGYSSISTDSGSVTKTSTENVKLAGTAGEIATVATTDDTTLDIITFSLPATLSTAKTVSGGWTFNTADTTFTTNIIGTGLVRKGPSIASFATNPQVDLNDSHNYFAVLNGTATDTNAFLALNQDNTTSNNIGLLASAYAEHTTGTKGSLIGGNFTAAAEAAGLTTNIKAIQAQAYVQGTSGNVSKLIGNNVFLSVNVSGVTVTDAIGYWVESFTKPLGTITTVYGIKVENQTVGATNYSLFTGTGLVQFGDALTIQPTTDKVPFIVNAASGQTADLAQFKINGTIIAKIDSTGSFIIPAGAPIITLGDTSSTVGAIFKGFGGDAASNAEPAYLQLQASPAASGAFSYFFPCSTGGSMGVTSSAPAADCTEAQKIILSGVLTTEGDIFFRNATVTTRLARGTNGQCLTSNTTTIVWGSCGGGGGPEFPDNTFRVTDDGDTSKKLAFQISGFTTATTRTLTPPNLDGTIAILELAQTFTDTQTISKSQNATTQLIVENTNTGASAFSCIFLKAGATTDDFNICTSETNARLDFGESGQGTRWFIDGAGIFAPGADNTYDIGSSGNSVRNIWVDGSWIANGSTIIDSSRIMTNISYDAEGTGNTLTTVAKGNFVAAGCNNTTAAPAFDIPTSNGPTANCYGTSPHRYGGLAFPDGATDLTSNIHFKLPSDWSGNIDIDIVWTCGTGTCSTNNMILRISTVCVANTEDLLNPTYNAAQTITDAGLATAGQRNTASLTSVTTTGCIASETMFMMIGRDLDNAGDTLAADVVILDYEVTMRRAQ